MTYLGELCGVISLCLSVRLEQNVVSRTKKVSLVRHVNVINLSDVEEALWIVRPS